MRRELKRIFKESPQLYPDYIEAAMKQAVAPSVDRAIYATEWARESALVTPNRPSVAWTWLVAHIHEHLQKDEVPQARTLSALVLGMSEQIGMDGGDWTLGYLLTLVQEPPFSRMTARKPDPQEICPHTNLMDERWVAACVSYIKEADQIVERRLKIVKEHKATRQKGDPKGDGKGNRKKGDKKEE